MNIIKNQKEVHQQELAERTNENVNLKIEDTAKIKGIAPSSIPLAHVTVTVNTENALTTEAAV